jgi:hypothetical protein
MKMSMKPREFSGRLWPEGDGRIVPKPVVRTAAFGKAVGPELSSADADYLLLFASSC